MLGHRPLTTAPLGTWPALAAVLNPDGDITAGSWVRETGSAVNLYQSIDEITADDSDYIRSSYDPVTDIAEVSLTNPDPANVPILPFTVNYRYGKFGSSQIDLVVRLRQGTTNIASWTHTNIPQGPVNASQSLSSGELASITDFNDLRLRFEANKV